MTDLDVLEELHDLFGGSLVPTKVAKAHYKPTWVWSVQGDQAESAMKSLRPYMFQRRTQAIDQALEVWQTRKNTLEAARQRGIEAARAYLNNEGSLRQLAQRFGVGYETIRRYAKELDSQSSVA
jgi:Trp operon repressor